MEIDRIDGRTPNQLRPLACSRNILNRAHGSASWSQGDTKVLAAVYGPKAGTKKNENPEKACIEVLWKPKTGQSGKLEKEYEMVLKRTLQSICILTINPNTTTSVIIQVVNDDGALLPCAINAACAALVDAGIPLKHLAVAICCGLVESGYVILDPTKLEEQKIKAFAYLVFPNSVLSILPKGSLLVEGEPMEHGIITSVTQGAMPGTPFASLFLHFSIIAINISIVLFFSLAKDFFGIILTCPMPQCMLCVFIIICSVEIYFKIASPVSKAISIILKEYVFEYIQLVWLYQL